MAAWRADYNLNRPHSRLGWLTPTEYADTFNPRRDLALRSMQGSVPAPCRSPGPDRPTQPPESTSRWIEVGGNVTGLQPYRRCDYVDEARGTQPLGGHFYSGARHLFPLTRFAADTVMLKGIQPNSKIPVE